MQNSQDKPARYAKNSLEKGAEIQIAGAAQAVVRVVPHEGAKDATAAEVGLKDGGASSQAKDAVKAAARATSESLETLLEHSKWKKTKSFYIPDTNTPRQPIQTPPSPDYTPCGDLGQV